MGLFDIYMLCTVRLNILVIIVDKMKMYSYEWVICNKEKYITICLCVLYK